MEATRGDYRNLFLQYAPAGDFDVRTRVSFEPRADGDKAFLCIWQDHDNYIRLSTVSGQGHKLESASEIGRNYSAEAFANRFGGTVQLRILKRGTRYTFFASADGRSWSPVGKAVAAELHNIRVGVGALASREKSAGSARFESFELLP